MTKTRVTELLGIERPVIQAAMTWITSAKMVSAVSNGGGLGVLGPNAGQMDKASSMTESIENVCNEIRKVKELTDKPFGVNFLLPMKYETGGAEYADKLFEAIIEEEVKVAVVVSYGEESDFSYLNKLKEKGVKVLYRDISPTVQGAIEAEKRGVDAIIVTGHEAGGHLSRNRISTLVLLSLVMDVANVPVIAAGGIYNARTARATFAMGAEGVYIGTRFINTFECPAHELCKDAIIQSRSENLLELDGLIRIISKEPIEIISLKKENYISSFRDGMLLGKTDSAHICVSEGAAGIHNIVSCQELIREIMGL